MPYLGANKNMKTNSLGLCGRFANNLALSIAAFVICVLALMAAAWWLSSPQRIVHVTDKLTNSTYKQYAKSSFGEVTNALSAYIQFLNMHEQVISGRRDMDVLLGSAHRHLAYMLLFSNDADAAVDHFEAAYKHYKQQRARDGIEELPRSEFVAWVIQGREKTDATYGAAWKSDGKYTLNSNTLSKVNAAFAHDPQWTR